MHRKQWVSVLVVLAVTALMTGAAFAQRGAGAGGAGMRGPGHGPGAGELGPPGGPFPGGPPPGFGGPPPEVLEQLGLSSAQQAKIAALRDESERKMIRAEADARIAELDVRALLEAETPDAAAIDAAIDRAGTLRTAMQKIGISGWLGIRAVLTAEQRAKLPKLARRGPPDREGRTDAPERSPGGLPRR